MCASSTFTIPSAAKISWSKFFVLLCWLLSHTISRVKINEVKKAEAKVKGEKISCKRLPKQPTPAHFVTKTEPTELRPIRFEFLQ